MIAAAVGSLRALSRRAAFRDEVRAALSGACDALGDRTLRSLLEQLWAFVATPVFAEWAGEWLV